MTDFNMLMVSGSRTIKDYDFVANCLEETKKLYDYDTILTGGADGVDSFAEFYARMNLINHFIIYPKWKKHGKKAGIMRNNDMVEMANQGIAIWDGKSKGTKHAIRELSKKGILIKVFLYERTGD